MFRPPPLCSAGSFFGTDWAGDLGDGDGNLFGILELFALARRREPNLRNP